MCCLKGNNIFFLGIKDWVESNSVLYIQVISENKTNTTQVQIIEHKTVDRCKVLLPIWIQTLIRENNKKWNLTFRSIKNGKYFHLLNVLVNWQQRNLFKCSCPITACVLSNKLLQRYICLVTIFYRGQPELKEKIALCVGLIGGILGNEAGR